MSSVGQGASIVSRFPWYQVNIECMTRTPSEPAQLNLYEVVRYSDFVANSCSIRCRELMKTIQTAVLIALDNINDFALSIDTGNHINHEKMWEDVQEDNIRFVAMSDRFVEIIL